MPNRVVRKSESRMLEEVVVRANTVPLPAGSADHGQLAGLGDDDHAQYVHLSAARSIGAQHTFNPAAAGAPFYLGANAQGQTVAGFRADQLNKSVLVSDGLSGGGVLTGDVTLSVALSANPGLEFNAGDLQMGLPSQVSAVTSNSVTGATHAHSVLAYADATVGGQAGHLLKTDVSGNLKLNRLIVVDEIETDRIESPVGDILSLYGENALRLDSSQGSIEAHATLKGDGWVSGFLGSAWGITEAGAGDFRSIYAEELRVTAFTAEVYRVHNGDIWAAKDVTEVLVGFAVPAIGASTSITVADAPGFEDTPIFDDNDYVLVRYMDRSGGGLVLLSIWGQVTTYVNSVAGDGQQSWTFTTRYAGGSPVPAGAAIQAGALILNFGQSGDGWWQATSVGSFAPYSQVSTWAGSDPWTPANRTTWTRLGNLEGIGQPAGTFGLYAGDGTGAGDSYVIAGNNGVEVRNAPLSLTDGGGVTRIKLDPNAGAPYIALGSPIPTGYLSQTGWWAGLDSGTPKFYVGEVSGGALVKGASWDGSSFNVVGDLIVGPGIGFIIDRPEILCNFNGPAPYRLDYSVDVSGHLGQKPLLIGNTYPIGLEGIHGKGFVAADASTNYVHNASFETAGTPAASWQETTYGDISGTVARTTTWARYGTYSLYMSVANINSDGFLGAVNLDYTAFAPGDIAVVSGWAKNYGTVSAAPFLQVRFYDASFVTLDSQNIAWSLDPGDEEYLTGSFVAPANTAYARVYIWQERKNSASCMFDGIQLEKRTDGTSSATPFIDGDMPGYTWAGTAHDSPAVRPASNYLKYDKRLASPLRGAAIIRFKASSGLNVDKTRGIFNIGSTSFDQVGIKAFIYQSNHFYVRIRDSASIKAVVNGQAYPFNAEDEIVIAVSWRRSGTFGGWVYINGVYQGGGTVAITSLPGEWPDDIYVGHGYSGTRLNGVVDEFAILPYEIDKAYADKLVASGLPMAAIGSPHSLLLTGENQGKIIGNAGGIFAHAADGAHSFSLLNADYSGTLGGFSNPGQGDAILGDRSVGASLFWDKSAGKLGFYGTASASPQVEVGTDGAVTAGAGTVQLDENGIFVRAFESTFDITSPGVIPFERSYYFISTDGQDIGLYYGAYKTNAPKRVAIGVLNTADSLNDNVDTWAAFGVQPLGGIFKGFRVTQGAGNLDASAYVFAETIGLQGEVNVFTNLTINSGQTGGGVGVIGIRNAAGVPAVNPSLGTVLYAQSGALKARGSSGTITTIAPAEPHCPVCGTDYVLEWENEKFGHLAICGNCLAAELGERAWIWR